MATISPVKVCPFCEAQLETPPPASCPSCRSPITPLKNSSTKFFDAPDYLFFQRNEHVKRIAEDKLTPDSPSYAQRFVAIHADLERFVRQAPPDELLAALFDAHIIVTHALHARLPPQALSKLVATAKAIGAIGEAIDKYTKVGGGLYEREIGPLPSASGGGSGGAATAD